jgi:hypothetical protein
VRLISFWGSAGGLTLYMEHACRDGTPGAVSADGVSGRAASWFYVGRFWPVPVMFTYPRWEVDASKAVQFVGRRP